MKRTVALLLVLILTVSLPGCKEEFVHPTSPNATASTAPTEPEGVYIQDSYSVTDQKAKEMAQNIVATIGDIKLTNSLFHAYYWMAVRSFMDAYGSSALFLGLNYTKPLDEQLYDAKTSWQQYFVADGLQVWHRYQSMALMAEQKGIPMNDAMQKELENLYETLEKSLEKSGYNTVDELIQGQMGAGCTFEDYYRYTEIFYRGYSYFEHQYGQINITQADIDAYFAENQTALEKENIKRDGSLACTLRHILIRPTGGKTDADGKVTCTDEQWEAARVKAQSLLDQWLAGEATEESFAALAKEHSHDDSSKAEGGLYEGLYSKSNQPKEMKDWYLAEGRRSGDYTLVKSDYGYHILRVSQMEELWVYFCRSILMENAQADIINQAILAFPAKIHYENIGLATVTLVAAS